MQKRSKRKIHADTNWWLVSILVCKENSNIKIDRYRNYVTFGNEWKEDRMKRSYCVDLLRKTKKDHYVNFDEKLVVGDK